MKYAFQRISLPFYFSFFFCNFLESAWQNTTFALRTPIVRFNYVRKETERCKNTNKDYLCDVKKIQKYTKINNREIKKTQNMKEKNKTSPSLRKNMATQSMRQECNKLN